ncbi:MAG: ATP-binding cassette domain-containing protein, partial [Gordonia sp. (in: high G+C Gram-positive bacteria)]
AAPAPPTTPPPTTQLRAPRAIRDRATFPQGPRSGPAPALPRPPGRAIATPAIEVIDLHKRFGDQVAVDGVSFRADRGSVLALLGPNGAGKTTTVNMLCTLLRPDSGHAWVADHDVTVDPAGVRRSIMLTGQFAALDEALTGRENLILFGRLLGLRKAAAVRRADELLDAFGLEEAAKRRVGQYSGGMRRRIDIACGLVTSPDVVFLDEPTTGLDPRSRQEVWRLVKDLRRQGVTTLLTTQYLEEADALSDAIVVIDHGRVIAEGTADSLKSHLGTSSYEVTPSDPAQLGRLYHVLGHLINPGRARSVDIDGVSLTVPAPDGADVLVEIVRRTSAAGIRLADVALRRPSLDEVFLALTDPEASGARREPERRPS